MAAEWYVQFDGETFGPMPAARVKKLAANGRVMRDTLVRKGVDGQWVSARRIKGLFDVENSQPAAFAAGDTGHVALPIQPPTVPPVAPPPTQVPLSPAAPEPMHIVHTVGGRVSYAAHSLGIAAVVLGVVAVATLCIPVISMPLAGLGTLLGIVGLVIAIARKGTGVGYSIAGTAIAGIVLLIEGLVVAGAISVIANVEEIRQKARQTVQAQAENDTPGGSSGETEVAKPVEWADASKPVLQGDVKLAINGARVGKVSVRYLGDLTSSASERLTISIVVQNMSQTRKLEYSSWSGSNRFSLDDAPTLTDEHGNTYKRTSFGIGTDVVGQVTTESIYPAKAVADLLVFEPPIDAANELYLELPATAFGGEGMLRIKIPRSMISR